MLELLSLDGPTAFTIGSTLLSSAGGSDAGLLDLGRSLLNL